MKDPRWTPGPWEVTETSDLMLFVQPVGSEAIIATVESFEEAQLIAASIDLFDALDWAMAEIEGRTRYDNDQQRDNCIEIARAALAKAKGDDQ